MIFRAEVYTEEQLNAVLNNPAIEKVYVPYSLIKKEHYTFKDRIIVIPPVFLGDCEDKLADIFFSLRKEGFTNVLVHTTGHISLFSGMSFNLFGGYRLNCTNSESIEFFHDENVKDIIVSPETTSAQMKNLKNSSFGFIAYGYLPLMITRRCPLKNGKPCNSKSCNRVITDRKGNNLNVICSENTSEILNSDVLYLADKMNNFSAADFAVLKFTVENDTDEVISRYLNEEPCNFNNFTRGLYFRGVKE